VLKNLADPKHPFSRFGTGNLRSLRDIPLEKGMNIRQILLEFHNRYYSANIMKLVVLGKDTIEQLTEWIVEKFSSVKNMNVTVPTFSSNPLSKEQLTTSVMLKPVKDTRQLMLIFPVSDYGDSYRTHPLQYFSHLIGHEGPGSILSLLKSKGWAHSLMVGSAGYGGIGFEFFRVVIDMTEKGLSHSNEIIKVVFQYIGMLKKHGVLEWIFNECQSISRMAFRFKEKASPSSYVSSLAGNMQKFKANDVISGSYLVEDFDKDVIASCFEYLTPTNLQIFLVASEFQPDDEWEICPWYGSKYHVVPMDSRLKGELVSLQSNSELHLPDHNEFIAENFTVSHPKALQPKKVPTLVLDTALIRFWHKEDDTFMVPKANVYIEIRTPIAYHSAKNCMLTRLFSDLLKDTLNEFSYFAEVAGLSFDLENTTDGIILSLHGFNDKLHVLLSEICSKMATFPADDFHFHRVKDATIRKLKGWYHEAPYSHATYFMSGFTQEKLLSTEEKLAVMDPITLEDVKDFYRSILDHCHIECFVHGNINVQVFFVNIGSQIFT
jgi:insulysin